MRQIYGFNLFTSFCQSFFLLIGQIISKFVGGVTSQFSCSPKFWETIQIYRTPILLNFPLGILGDGASQNYTLYELCICAGSISSWRKWTYWISIRSIINILPRKLRWNLKILPGKGETSTQTTNLLGSMLIFAGFSGPIIFKIWNPSPGAGFQSSIVNIWWVFP